MEHWVVYQPRLLKQTVWNWWPFDTGSRLCWQLVSFHWCCVWVCEGQTWFSTRFSFHNQPCYLSFIPYFLPLVCSLALFLSCLSEQLCKISIIWNGHNDTYTLPQSLLKIQKIKVTKNCLNFISSPQVMNLHMKHTLASFFAPVERIGMRKHQDTGQGVHLNDHNQDFLEVIDLYCIFINIWTNVMHGLFIFFAIYICYLLSNFLPSVWDSWKSFLLDIPFVFVPLIFVP